MSMIKRIGCFVAAIALGAWSGIGLADEEEKFDAAKFVGRWEVTRSEAGNVPKGTIVEFTKDGKLVVIVEVGGQTVTCFGTYKVLGDKLEATLEPPGGGPEVSDTDTIKTLTQEKIVLVEKGQKELEFVRKK